MGIVISDVRRYPVKSCRGEQLRHGLVEPWGFAGDRRYMLIDEDGTVVTAREHPRLLLVTPRLEPDGVSFRGPDGDAVRAAIPVSDTELVPVRVFKSELVALPMPGLVNAWFSALLELPVRLVYLDDPTRRPTNPEYSQDGDRVSFADGYPFLLASTGSLAALNELIAAGPLADQGPMSMTRFRPNLVIDGAPAWAEDDWSWIQIGEARFRVAKPCDRCVMTTYDPTTIERGHEPLATLARHRRFEGKVLFALNLIPDTPGATINVGDEVVPH
jgi:uncharacterized protein YcbX